VCFGFLSEFFERVSGFLRAAKTRATKMRNNDILKIITNCYTYDNYIGQYYSNYSGAMLPVQQCYDIPKLIGTVLL